MDKPPVPDLEQKHFYDLCTGVFRATARNHTRQYIAEVFGTFVGLECPIGSVISMHLPGVFTPMPDKPPERAVRLFMTDSSSPGFAFPDAPFDRFRFTHRGDILGFEEGHFRAFYHYRSKALSVVNMEEHTAVIFFRDAAATDADVCRQMIISTLSILLIQQEILFLPVKKQAETNFLCPLVGSPPGLFPANNEKYILKYGRDFPESWVAVKISPSPAALFFNSVPENPRKIDTLVLDESYLIPQTGPNEILLFRIYNQWLFNLMSCLPFAGPDHVSLLTTLMRTLSSMIRNDEVPTDDAFQPVFTCLGVLPDNPLPVYPSLHLPSLSVIIPAYNAATFLKEAVASVISLQYPDTELIIVDDGSVDWTARLVAELALPCRYLYQENAGAGAARNRGLEVSNGELLLFLDADDLLNPPTFWSLLQWLTDHPEADAVAGFAQKFVTTPRGDRVFTGNPAESFPWYIGTTLFRRRAFSRNGPFDEELRFSEDTDWFKRAMENNSIVLKTCEISLFVRRHEASLTGNITLHDLQLMKMLRKSKERKS